MAKCQQAGDECLPAITDFFCTVSRKKRKCPPKRSPDEESIWKKRDGLRAGRLGEGNAFSEKFPSSRRPVQRPSALKQPPEPARSGARCPARWASRSFQAGRYRFKQGKVARKLFAPGIGEGRHARQFVLDGLLAAAHERQAALVADIRPRQSSAFRPTAPTGPDT